ncbi:GntR family transcriptional regulator [Micromonospora sp. CP22]|uniref:GntR family transcriptional regulator n=1 Tax=Micromonospora sp. CP22 TaxID=2580517 RepID=UPI0018AD1F8D
MPTPSYGQPRYRVIADELRERIESGLIPPGALLPAESVLTAEFRVARGTIRKAIAVLREEGYAISEHGRGTYAPAQADRRVDASEQQQELPADAHLADLFKVAPGTMLVARTTVIRRSNQVDTVVRTYRLRPKHPSR